MALVLDLTVLIDVLRGRPALRILPIRRAGAERAGRWRREFAARGVTLHQADCLIAAAAYSAGGRPATADAKDFTLPGLSVEEWPFGG